MNTARRTAIIVGSLFIIATAASIVGEVVTRPILAEPDYLGVISAAPNTVVLGVLFYFLAAGAIGGIPIMLFPIFKRHGETLAFWFLGARFFEAIIFIVGGIFTLSLVSLAREYAGASTTDASHIQTLGVVMRGAEDAAFRLGTMIFFSLSAVILSIILYQTILVPRWLSIWTFVGALMLLVLGILSMFEAATPTLEIILVLPIAVNEMVLAAWLIIKGFDASALRALSIETEVSDAR